MSDFKGRHFRGDVILWAVRLYCRYGISYRDLETMLAERGVSVDHSTIYRWVQPEGRAPRILASRSVFVADDRAEALRMAEKGLSRQVKKFRAAGHTIDDTNIDTLIRTFDVHIGTPEEVIVSLLQDRTLDHATEIAIQVHSIDPEHHYILRSLELFATEVAPALREYGFVV